MNNTIRTLTGAALLAVSLSAAAAQTCNDNIPLTRPDARYTANDGTVTDTVTGLMWKQCAEGLSGADCTTITGDLTYTWQQALEQAKTANDGVGFATHTDWRLPNLKELRSLVETACYSPAINETYFPATPPAIFWSSSPVASGSAHAWSVLFDGDGDAWNNKFLAARVRLVRAGQ